MKRKEAIAWRRKIEAAAETQTDEAALESIDLFPKWKPEIDVAADERYQYGGKLYRVIQPHRTQAYWTPDITPALFVEVSIEEIPEWVQPISAETSYHLGDKTKHNGHTWESEYDNNTWEPGVFGWRQID